MIVIDSDVIPSPDFLFFMAQLLPVLKKDPEVSFITGWSSNCYKSKGNVHLAYRIYGTPIYAALISAKNKSTFQGDMFAPDVARVQGPDVCHLPSLEWGKIYHKVKYLYQKKRIFINPYLSFFFR